PYLAGHPYRSLKWTLNLWSSCSTVTGVLPRRRTSTACNDIFTDDVSIEWPQSGEHFKGKEACLNIFRNYPGGSPRLDSIDRVTGEGSNWVVEGKMTYPDKRQYILVGIFQMANGKIVREVDYFTEPFPVPDWRKQ